MNAVPPVPYAELIRAVRPDLAGVPLEVSQAGWDNVAVFAGSTIFRFPRHDAARERLAREPKTIAFAAPHVALRLPLLRLHNEAGDDFNRDPSHRAHASTMFCEHERVPGDMLDPLLYHALDEVARDRLAEVLAATYAALHRLDPDDAIAAGCAAVTPWPLPEAVFTMVRGRIDLPMLGLVARIAAVAGHDLPDEPVFGHFDTHGWNMAFDHAAGRLVGLYDFGASGVGQLHRDLGYTLFIAPDLAARVVTRYVRQTGRSVDFERVLTLHTYLRIVEIAEGTTAQAADRAWYLTDFLAALARWRTASPGQASGRMLRAAAGALNDARGTTV